MDISDINWKRLVDEKIAKKHKREEEEEEKKEEKVNASTVVCIPGSVKHNPIILDDRPKKRLKSAPSVELVDKGKSLLPRNTGKLGEQIKWLNEHIDCRITAEEKNKIRNDLRLHEITDKASKERLKRYVFRWMYETFYQPDLKEGEIVRISAPALKNIYKKAKRNEFARLRSQKNRKQRIEEINRMNSTIKELNDKTEEQEATIKRLSKLCEVKAKEMQCEKSHDSCSSGIEYLLLSSRILKRYSELAGK